MRSPSDSSVQFLKGVGPQRKKVFERLGVKTVEDLSYLFPRRYEDRRQMTPLSQVKIGEWQTITGQILNHCGRKSWHTKKHVYEIAIGDATSRIFCVWFNRPYLDRYFQKGQTVVVYGKIDLYKGRLQIVSPDYEIITGDEEDQALSVGRIVPIYPLTRGMTQRYVRKIVKRALDQYGDFLNDVLPSEIRQKHHLETLKKSLWQLHFPETFEQQKEAYVRVSFEEFFLFQVSVFLRRFSIIKEKGVAHKISEGFCEDFLKLFPFSLTASQRQVLNEIKKDLSSLCPMHRLLQGDVGSGKTLVALFGCLAAIENQYQAAVMVPTEILARQHFENLKGLVHKFQDLRKKRSRKNQGSSCRHSFSHAPIALLLSSASLKERQAMDAAIRQGEILMVVGTHALIQQDIQFKNLSFVVIDEQHKFGVQQRAMLSTKGINPDMLVMTATPIPRTLCLTLYGDLDVSTLRELPPGRGAICTRVFYPHQEREAYAIIREAIKRREQAYIVYPLVDESENLDVKSAQQMFDRFQKEEFKECSVGLIHGQMKKDQAQRIMERFREQKIDILVATTVLEVGVDVPNATVMLIEHAERFGLSQLHQLRGRIGRGQKQSQCLLIADPTTPDGKARIEAISSTIDGFEIAQKDLMIRGPGEFFGRHQHGLNELKIANPQTQLNILEKARQEALELTQGDPGLQNRENLVIKEAIIRRYPNYLQNILSG